jgi:ATP-dependent Lon protease
MAIIKMDRIKSRSSKKDKKEKEIVVSSSDEEDDDFETLSDTDSDSDDESSDEDETEFDDFIDDDEDESISSQSLRKLVSKAFPSKYMDKRVKSDGKLKKLIDKEFKRQNKVKDQKKKSKKHKNSDSDSEEDSSDSEDESIVKKSSKKNKIVSKHNTRSKSASNKLKQQKKHHSDSESNCDKNDEAEDDEDEEDDNEDEEDDQKKKKQNINIIFGFGPNGQAGDDEEMEDEHALLDEEECDSDDEKMFMKETYQTVDLPQQISEDKKKNTKKNKSKNAEEIKQKESNENIKFNSEYNDLTEMKKYLAENLKNKPKSIMLLKALKECNHSIKKLVKKERGKNTKEYHKMIHGQDRKFTSEIDYFKKKLSNQEQQRIMKDLKEINSHIQIDKPYRLSLLDSNIPAKYKATVLQKLNVLRTMEPGDPEYYKMKNWIDTFMRIPIGVYKSLSVKMSDGTEACQNFMEKSIRKLDDCVFGMNDAKMQIIQMVGQWMTNPGSMGTAIAIQGPPGTGKTSIVKEGISQILGREFAFIALGGAGDSSFLEGHSYTYEGSSWGKILQILIDSKCMNPVIYFDELDKLSDSPRGAEIASILTHLTDTSQNSEFHDKYFSEMSFDLSKCLFIFSYNDESKVNPILKDRMYRIQTKGYNTKEKITIAKNYMLPKIREQVNFEEGMIIIPDDTLEYIITKSSFTKNEDGVRNLKRCLEIVHTKLNLFRLINPDNEMFAKEIKMKVTFPFTVTRKEVDLLIKEDDTQNHSMLAMYV